MSLSVYLSKVPVNQKTKIAIHGVFSVRVKDRKSATAIRHTIKYDCNHARNMVLILHNKLYELIPKHPELKDIHASFCSVSTLRNAVYGWDGKSADKIKHINQVFSEEGMMRDWSDLFFALKAFCQSQLDPKTFHSILIKIKSSYEQFYTNIAEYSKNPVAYAAKFGNSGAPRPPKPKRLKLINNASLMMDREKWTLKKDRGERSTRRYIRLKLANKYGVKVPINWEKFDLPKGSEINSIDVNVRNDGVYLNFAYGKRLVETAAGNAEETKGNPLLSEKPKVWAGCDVGMINVLTIVTTNASGDSLIVGGNAFKNYNKQFNRHKARLDKSIANEATEFKSFTRTSDGAEVKIAMSHSDVGMLMKRTRTHMIERRNRYFNSEMDKLSKRVVDFALREGVTDFVLSKNLPFLKTDDTEKSALHSSTKQSFYHLPLGKLLNHIERKLKLVGIRVHSINEAYTSKVSCISGDVRGAKALRTSLGRSLLTKDCQGSRVKRGRYRDHKTTLQINADCNAAVNHIKLANPDYEVMLDTHLKQKLCNPIKVKSDLSFCQYLAA
jgi:IS605 OrfB family transposase